MDFIIALIIFIIVGSCLYLNKKIALIILIVLACCGGCSYFNKKLGFPDDNFFEELFEDQIEEELGINIDLTPKSKEALH